MQGFNSRRPQQLVSANHSGGQAPVDISATYKGKGGRGKGNKGYKGKGKGYGKAKGKAKGKHVWQPVTGTDKGQGKNKGANNQGKGKNSMAVCYRCGQPGHLAKDCKTAVYNLSDTTYEHQHDNTAHLYYPNNGYDASWYNSDQNRLLPGHWATIPTAPTNTTTCADSTTTRNHDRQWCSNTCLPTMVCAQHTCTHSNMGKGRNGEQQQMKLFQCVDTNGY